MNDQKELLPLDEQIIATLVGNHKKFLSFIDRRVGNKAVAEEILQTAFVKSLGKGDQLRDGEGAIAWFYRLLRNAIVDHYRKQEVERRAASVRHEEVESDSELRGMICECMSDLIPTLKPEYADLLREVDLNERSVSEVAEEKGITANNAMVRLHRARTALKRQLEKSCGSCTAHGCLDCSCGRRG